MTLKALPRPTTADKCRTFRALHESGCFVIPNPWNIGSARYLEGLGFKALATTSSGYAHSQGLPDVDTGKPCPVRPEQASLPE